MTRKNFRLTVFKADRRCKTGLRTQGAYTYTDVDPRWMAEEVRELRTTLYRAADGFVLAFEELSE